MSSDTKIQMNLEVSETCCAIDIKLMIPKIYCHVWLSHSKYAVFTQQVLFHVSNVHKQHCCLRILFSSRCPRTLHQIHNCIIWRKKIGPQPNLKFNEWDYIISYALNVNPETRLLTKKFVSAVPRCVVYIGWFFLSKKKVTFFQFFLTFFRRR